MANYNPRHEERLITAYRRLRNALRTIPPSPIELPEIHAQSKRSDIHAAATRARAALRDMSADPNTIRLLDDMIGHWLNASTAIRRYLNSGESRHADIAFETALKRFCETAVVVFAIR